MIVSILLRTEKLDDRFWLAVSREKGLLLLMKWLS